MNVIDDQLQNPDSYNFHNIEILVLNQRCVELPD